MRSAPHLEQSDEGPEFNARGLFAIGPQLVTASDLLVRLQSFTHCEDPTPDRKEERRAMRFYCGRRAAAKRNRQAAA